jgi:8-oxo-dGTP pyrophosphatase MutT (NUDIX family)
MQHLQTLIARLRAQAELPPRRARVDLWLNEFLIGSVEPLLLQAVQTSHYLSKAHAKLHERTGAHAGWQLSGHATPALKALARALREAELCGDWRDEQLAVRSPQGDAVGTIERGAARPLGIATHAVHLLGWTGDGRMWVQQRSHRKSVDPGQWDTLVGGMVPADETMEQALRRESMEEAGLDVRSLQALQHAGMLRVSRPSPEAKGAGYLLETMDWYTATVPDGVKPHNLDGEVEQFACLAPDSVVEWINEGLFAQDAALMLAEALLARLALGKPSSV